MKTIAGASRPIIGLLATAASAGDRELQSMIVDRLTTERGYPIAGSMAVLRAGAQEGVAKLGLVPLIDDCTRVLSERVNAPPRAPGDWSITAQLGCTSRTTWARDLAWLQDAARSSADRRSHGKARRPSSRERS